MTRCTHHGYEISSNTNHFPPRGGKLIKPHSDNAHRQWLIVKDGIVKDHALTKKVAKRRVDELLMQT